MSNKCILLLFLTFAITIGLIVGCIEKASEGDATPTPVTTEEPTTAPTEEPTSEPTQEPKETIPPGTGQYAGGIASDEEVWALFYDENDSGHPTQVTGSMAAQFFATTEFDKLSVAFVTYGAPKDPPYHIYYYLFAWQGTYDDTLKSEPLVEEKKVNFNDWENVELSFDPLPDGEYLLYILNDESFTFIGVFNRVAGHESHRAFKDDQLWEDKTFSLRIHYTKTPNNLYGPLSEPW